MGFKYPAPEPGCFDMQAPVPQLQMLKWLPFESLLSWAEFLPWLMSYPECGYFNDSIICCYFFSVLKLRLLNGKLLDRNISSERKIGADAKTKKERKKKQGKKTFKVDHRKQNSNTR